MSATDKKKNRNRNKKGKGGKPNEQAADARSCSESDSVPTQEAVAVAPPAAAAPAAPAPAPAKQATPPPPAVPAPKQASPPAAAPKQPSPPARGAVVNGGPAASSAAAACPASAKAGEEAHKQLLQNLAQDFASLPSNYLALREAEKKYAQTLAQPPASNKKNAKESKKPAARKDSDSDIDLFASDEGETVEKPKMVAPKPKEQKKAPAAKKPQKEEKGKEAEACSKSSLATEIEKARHHIMNSLDCVEGIAALANAPNQEMAKRVVKLEEENKSLRKVTDDLRQLVKKLEGRVAHLEKDGGKKSAAAPAKKDDDDDDDDEEVDLFGSDEDEEEDAEKVRIREQRLKDYYEKKSKKPALIAKTSVLLDVKPWDDETDMDAMLEKVLSIHKEGLVWGASKLVPVGYGINKLQVMCVVEDEKVSIDELCEQITEFEDLVQSVDIAAMSKI